MLQYRKEERIFFKCQKDHNVFQFVFPLPEGLSACSLLQFLLLQSVKLLLKAQKKLLFAFP